MMRRDLWLLVCVMVVWMAGGSMATAFSLSDIDYGLKVESAGWSSYNAIGMDLEFDSAAAPVVFTGDALGWISMRSGQPTHAQLGIGARFFADNTSEGLYGQGGIRLVVQGLNPQNPLQASTGLLVGGGYRIPDLFGMGLVDITANATVLQHHVLPQFFVGARIDF